MRWEGLVMFREVRVGQQEVCRLLQEPCHTLNFATLSKFLMDSEM